MKVNFEFVRLGKISHNNVSEKVLKQDVHALKKSIQLFLEDFNLNDKIDILIVIPSKGHNIKFSLYDIQDPKIKAELRQNFSKTIYNGEYSKIITNLQNAIFSPLL